MEVGETAPVWGNIDRQSVDMGCVEPVMVIRRSRHAATLTSQSLMTARSVGK